MLEAELLMLEIDMDNSFDYQKAKFVPLFEIKLKVSIMRQKWQCLSLFVAKDCHFF
jgi:hypothetical protein